MPVFIFSFNVYVSSAVRDTRWVRDRLMRWVDCEDEIERERM